MLEESKYYVLTSSTKSCRKWRRIIFIHQTILLKTMLIPFWAMRAQTYSTVTSLTRIHSHNHVRVMNAGAYIALHVMYEATPSGYNSSKRRSQKRNKLSLNVAQHSKTSTVLRLWCIIQIRGTHSWERIICRPLLKVLNAFIINYIRTILIYDIMSVLKSANDFQYIMIARVRLQY